MYLYDVQSNIKIFHQKKGTIKAFFVFELVNPLPAKYLNFLRQFSDKAVQKPLTIHVIISTRHNRLRPDRKYRDSGHLCCLMHLQYWGCTDLSNLKEVPAALRVRIISTARYKMSIVPHL